MTWYPLPNLPVVSRTQAILFGVLAALLLSLASIAGGFWFGQSWQKGRAAKAQVDVLKGQIASAQESLYEAQSVAGTIAADSKAIQTTLTAIQKGLDDDTEKNREAGERLRQRLAAEISRNPALGDCRASDELLQIWRDANQGRDSTGAPGTGHATGSDSRWTENTMPRLAAPTSRRNAIRSNRQPHRNDDDLLQLPSPTKGAGARAGRERSVGARSDQTSERRVGQAKVRSA